MDKRNTKKLTTYIQNQLDSLRERIICLKSSSASSNTTVTYYYLQEFPTEIDAISSRARKESLENHSIFSTSTTQKRVRIEEDGVIPPTTHSESLENHSIFSTLTAQKRVKIDEVEVINARSVTSTCPTI